MNTKIAALKKKIEIKEKQLKSKQELAVRSKEAAKEIKREIELLNNELVKGEMQEMMELMGEKNLNIDDVKAAIASGAIIGTVRISNQIEEIHKEENTNV